MNRSRAEEILNRFSGKTILVVGDVMLDEFIWGKVSRISPEAPVPVVEVVDETYNAGGAANVARNLREFIADVHMLGLAGNGPNAERLREILAACGVGMDCVQVDPTYRTICKT